GFVREFQQSTLAQPVPQALLDTVVQESLKVPARVWKAALAALLDTDFSGELGKITAPTLIVWGDQDAFFLRREQEALAAAITGAQLMIYPGGAPGRPPHDIPRRGPGVPRGGAGPLRGRFGYFYRTRPSISASSVRMS